MHRRYEPTGNNMTPHPSQAGGHERPHPLQARGQGSGNNNPSTASGQNAKRSVGDAGPYNPSSTANRQNLKRTVEDAGPYRQGRQFEGDFDIHKKSDAKNPHPVTKFIPQSVYNPQTGKILGFLSAEDLLLLGLIFLLLDSGDECEDNSMLIYALLYILLSGHMDLPF